MESLQGIGVLAATSSIAEALYNAGCLKFGSFRIKSGALSPYYIDLACMFSSPKELRKIVGVTTEEIKRIMTSTRIDKLASIELKGALILPMIACQLELPCVIVRKADKGYGVAGRLAGTEVSKGERILFFDDVISDGASKLEGIRTLEELGAIVEDLIVVVDREQGGRERLEKQGYKVHALTSVSELVSALLQAGHISRQEAEAVMNYSKKS